MDKQYLILHRKQWNFICSFINLQPIQLCFQIYCPNLKNSFPKKLSEKNAMFLRYYLAAIHNVDLLELLRGCEEYYSLAEIRRILGSNHPEQIKRILARKGCKEDPPGFIKIRDFQRVYKKSGNL